MWMDFKHISWISRKEKNENGIRVSNKEDINNSSFGESNFTKENGKETYAWTHILEIERT